MTGSLHRLLLTCGLSLAVALAAIFSSPARFRAATYDGIAHMGGVRAWGLALLVLSLLLTYCLARRVQPVLIATTAILVSGWYGAWAGAFYWAAKQPAVINAQGQPVSVAWLGVLFFGYFMLLHVSIAWSAAGLLPRKG